MKQRLLLTLFAATLLAAFAAAQGPTASVATVQLLAFNDLHGNLEPPPGSSGRIHDTPAGGVAYLAAHVKRATETQPNSIVVAAGDLIGASPLISGLFRHEPTIEALNALGLSVSSVGNHEFDRGRRELKRLQTGGCHPTEGCSEGSTFGGARFQYLSANVVENDTRRTLFPATVVREVDGVKIGFIGETLKRTPTLLVPIGSEGLTFLDETETANRYARQLRQQGVRAIVLLVHEGGRQKPDDDQAELNGCSGFSGPIATIARKLSSDIKVVVSGHSHRFYTCMIGGHLVTSAGSYGSMLTRITLGIDRKSGQIVSSTAVNQIVTRDVPQDSEQAGIIAKYASMAAPVANRIAGSVRITLSRKENGAGESPLGDVIADAQLAAGTKAGAVLSFMNPGGIRDDVVFNEERTFARAGEVTYGELFTVEPFGNVLNVVTMTGDEIRRLLEQQFDNPPGENTILQVSKGFTYRYRSNAPKGRRVEAGSIAIDGRPVAPSDRLRVVVSDFLLGGGNGFTLFQEATDRTTVATDIDALVAYFQAHSPIEPGVQNRIVHVD